MKTREERRARDMETAAVAGEIREEILHKYADKLRESTAAFYQALDDMTEEYGDRLIEEVFSDLADEDASPALEDPEGGDDAYRDAYKEALDEYTRNDVKDMVDEWYADLERQDWRP